MNGRSCEKEEKNIVTIRQNQQERDKEEFHKTNKQREKYEKDSTKHDKKMSRISNLQL